MVCVLKIKSVSIVYQFVSKPTHAFATPWKNSVSDRQSGVRDNEFSINTIMFPYPSQIGQAPQGY
jgi:hypothetical protein